MLEKDSTWRHQKTRRLYQVDGLYELEADGGTTIMVAYRAVSDGRKWTRPLREWEEVTVIDDVTQARGNRYVQVQTHRFNPVIESLLWPDQEYDALMDEWHRRFPDRLFIPRAISPKEALRAFLAQLPPEGIESSSQPEPGVGVHHVESGPGQVPSSPVEERQEEPHREGPEDL
jgi:hypothetical protein